MRHGNHVKPDLRDLTGKVFQYQWITAICRAGAVVRFHPGRRTVPLPALPALLVLAAVLLAVLRTPDILSAGRFWAEEGVIHFRDAALGSWHDALLAPRNGYFSAFGKLAALAAAAVPLEWAPLVTVHAALAVQLAVVWIVARSDAFAGPTARALAAAVVVLAVPGAEVWLNTVNSQFHLALGAAVLLATSPGAVPAPFRLGFLALAGATGPVTAFLAPLFAWRAVRRPSARSLAEAAVIGLCAVVQAWLVARGLLEGERTGSVQAGALLSALAVKLLALPWLGGDAATGLSRALLSGEPASRYPAAAVLAATGAALAVTVLAHPTARLLAAMAAALAVPSFAGALGPDPWAMALPLPGGRYAYAPNALLGLAVLTVAAAPPAAPWAGLGLRLAATVLLSAFLAQGVVAYASPHGLFAGPDWRAEVAAWRADPGKAALAIWPPGWAIALPRPADAIADTTAR